MLTKEDWVRLLIHLPWGLIAAFPLTWGVWALQSNLSPYAVLGLLLVSALVSLGILFVELAYEGFNDWRKRDASFKDVIGIANGYILGIGGISLWLKSLVLS